MVGWRRGTAEGGKEDARGIKTLYVFNEAGQDDGETTTRLTALAVLKEEKNNNI